jgi:hypothetical protein
LAFEGRWLAEVVLTICIWLKGVNRRMMVHGGWTGVERGA